MARSTDEIVAAAKDEREDWISEIACEWIGRGYENVIEPPENYDDITPAMISTLLDDLKRTDVIMAKVITEIQTDSLADEILTELACPNCYGGMIIEVDGPGRFWGVAADPGDVIEVRCPCRDGTRYGWEVNQ